MNAFVAFPIDEVRFDRSGLSENQLTKLTTALHEAGHTTIALHCGINVEWATAVPEDGKGGLTDIIDDAYNFAALSSTLLGGLAAHDVFDLDKSEELFKHDLHELENRIASLSEKHMAEIVKHYGNRENFVRACADEGRKLLSTNLNNAARAIANELYFSDARVDGKRLRQLFQQYAVQGENE